MITLGDVYVGYKYKICEFREKFPKFSSPTLINAAIINYFHTLEFGLTAFKFKYWSLHNHEDLKNENLDVHRLKSCNDLQDSLLRVESSR